MFYSVAVLVHINFILCTHSVLFSSSAGAYLYSVHIVCYLGDSAGGNLSAAVCLALRNESFTPIIRAQALIYPVIQAINLGLPSYQQDNKGPILSRWAKKLYLFLNPIIIYCNI